MKKHFLIATFAVATIVGSLTLMAPLATAQRGPKKPAPAVGAWWYKGEAPPAGATPDLTGVWSGAGFVDLEKDVVPGDKIQFTPFGAARYAKVDIAADPNAHCMPPGPQRMTVRAHPTMIIQRPDVFAILSESEHVFRLVYTDGRGHAPEILEDPGYYGSSIGKWEAGTLVVDTVGITDKTWLDNSGHEHSDKLHLSERFRLADPNTIEYMVTFNDPVYFVKPFTVKKLMKRQVGDHLFDHTCLENEQDSKNLVPTIGGGEENH